MRKATVDLLWSVPCGGVSTAIGVSHRQHNGWVPSTALACGAELGQHQRSMRDRRIGTSTCCNVLIAPVSVTIVPVL